LKTLYSLTLCFVFYFCAIAYAQGNTDLLVVRGAEDYPPNEYMDNDRLTGLHIELIEYSAKELGLNLTIESYPWKRALLMIERGQADAISYITKTPERNKYAIFHPKNSLSLDYSGFIAYTPQVEFLSFDGSLTSIAKYSIGVQLGYAYGSEFDTFPNLNKIEIHSITQMLDTLKAGRIDLGIFSYREFHELKKQGLVDDYSFLEPSISKYNNYIAFARSSNRRSNSELEELSNQFAEVLSKFKTTIQYQRLLEKYDSKLFHTE
jgi:polar amino acid transport system substrate-binding protein